MIRSFSDIIRKQLFENKNTIQTIRLIKNLDETTQETIYGILLSDYYKIEFVSELMGVKSKLLFLFDDLDKVRSLIKEDNRFLALTLSTSREFYKSSFINKSVIMKQIEDHDKTEILSIINPLHMLDIISTTVEYNLDSYKEYYIDFLRKESLDDIGYALGFLACNLLELKPSLEKEYSDIICKFITSYYKWNTYNKKNNNTQDMICYSSKYMLDIKTRSHKYLIKKSSKDQKFLLYLLENYLFYSTTKDETEVNKVDEYIKNNTSPKMLKKLNIN